VRALRLVAGRARLHAHWRELEVRAPLVAARLGRLSLRDCHAAAQATICCESFGLSYAHPLIDTRFSIPFDQEVAPMRGSVVARDIVKSFGAETILDGVSLTVPAGTRAGVLGPNGIGKSTLLRILAGVARPDAGTIVRDGTAAYLPQEADATAGETLRAYLARRTGVAAAETAMDALAAGLATEPGLAAAYSDALERFLALGGADFAARAREVCAEVGLGLSLERPLATLSGGQAARARLAALLLARFDLFCLDEPTNDLDFDGLTLLERFVGSVRGTIVVVSHDRAFLERTVDRIVELEAETRRVREYAGGFGEFERMRAAARAAEEAAWAQYGEEHDRFSALLADRRTQARAGGKQADRRGTHAVSTKVRQAERRLERLERPDKPWNAWQLRLELAAGTRGGDVVASLEGGRRARRVPARAARPRNRVGRTRRDPRTERFGQDHVARRNPRSPPADIR
jgi:ATPase subunit of ABC transporter with duplicated ATPase domains